MNVEEAVRTRLSEPRLTEPAPSHAEFVDLLECAAHSPDHGRLQPWRWVLVDGAAREYLGAVFAADCAPQEAERRRGTPLRAPLLATLVFTPRNHASIAEWEQLAAAAGVANALMLLLHARGYGSIWRTGKPCASDAVRAAMGLAPAETLLGWLYIGTPEHSIGVRCKQVRPVAEKVTVLGGVAAARELSTV